MSAIAVGIAFTMVLLPATAVAQSTTPVPSQDAAKLDREAKKAAKKQAIEHGVKGDKHFKAGEFSSAYESYRQSNDLFHTPVTVLSMAQAKAKMGALIEARDLYDRVIKEELAPNAPFQFRNAQKDAKKELEELRGRIASVKVVLINPPAGVQVTIDGAEVAASKLSEPIEQNPGTYTVAVNIPKEPSISKSVKLREGAQDTVDFVFLKPEPAPPPKVVELPPPAPVKEEVKPKPAPPVIPPPESGTHRTVTTMAFTLGGAFLTVGLVTGAFWMSNNNAILENCDDTRCPLGVEPAINPTIALGRLALTGLIVGGFGLGTGTVLALVGDKKEEGAAQRTISLSPSLGGVTVKGAF